MYTYAHTSNHTHEARAHTRWPKHFTPMRRRSKTHQTRARADAQRAARRSLICACKRNDANMNYNIIYMILARIVCNTSVRRFLEPKMTPKFGTKNEPRVSDSASRGFCVRAYVRPNVCVQKNKASCDQAFELSMSCLTQLLNFRPRRSRGALLEDTYWNILLQFAPLVLTRPGAFKATNGSKGD